MDEAMENKIDLSVAAGLASSPFWVPLLQNANLVLTFITLLIGVVIGAHRLWAIYGERVKGLLRR